MLKIFSVYFDFRPVWKSDCVEPIQAGKTRTGLDLKMMADDTGDNISNENARYGEMTAWYWVWKNYLPSHPEVTYVGFSHYRRFLDFTGFCKGKTRRTTYRRFKRIFDRHYNERELLAAIGGADLVMRGTTDSGFATLREQYVHSHPENIEDFDRFVSLLKEKFASQEEVIDGVLNAGKLAMELQFVMTRELFVDFMEWTFSLCREFESRWSWAGEKDGSRARAPAFLVERLFMVWLALLKAKKGNVVVKELPIVKLTARPLWYHIIKPLFPIFPKSVKDSLNAKYK